MRDLSLFGKITRVLGELFFLIGVFLLIVDFDGMLYFHGRVNLSSFFV